MRIAIGADHAGYKLKEKVIGLLKELGHTYQDFGGQGEPGDDYPDFAAPVAQVVARGEFERGILVCGTGLGMGYAANKVPGIRAAVCHDTYSARLSREHNDANILCLGARVVGPGLALDIVRAWLNAEFSGEERHRRRIGKIDALEERG